MTAYRVRVDKRGEQVWKAAPILVDGKQRTRTFTVPSGLQRDADKEAERIRSDLRREAEQRAAAKPDPGTVRGFVRRWLEEIEVELSPTTMTSYRHYAAGIVDEFGARRLDEVTTADIRNWYARLARGSAARPAVSAATIDHYHRVLRVIMRRAVVDDLIAKPPTVGVKRPKPATKDMALPKDADMVELIGRTRGDVRIAVRIAAACGMRRGELVGLRWSDITRREFHIVRAMIDAEGGTVAKSTKGKRERTVSLDYGTLRVLAAHRRGQVALAAQLGYDLALRDDRYILANLELDPSGQRCYSASWLSHGWARARGDAPVRLHDIRHWYATKVLESRQASIAELSAWLGHAQVSTTLNIYTRADPIRRRVSSQIMGPLLGPGTESK